MQKNTNDTSNRTAGGGAGSPKKKALRPWEIAVRLFRSGERVVSVEQASDAEFQAFVDRHHIPVDDAGIAEWSFDDRVRAINFALRSGIELELFEPENNSNNSPNNSFSELFGSDESASQAG